MMNRILFGLVAVVGSLSLPTLNATEPTAEMLAKSSSNSINCAYFYSTSPQVGIGPGDVIEFTDIGFHGKNFDLSNNSGAIIKKRGYYLIQYQALVSSQATVALFRDGYLIPESTFSNISTTAPISGTMIVFLDNRDVLTLRSIENYKSFNTLMPTTISGSSIPVALTIQLLDN